MSVEALRRERPRRGEALDAVGRASRFACTLDAGTPAEMWCFATSDSRLVRRLVTLGVEGAFGFDAGFGDDEEGAFVLRRVPARTLDGLSKGERLEGLTALAKVRDLARALAACEKSAIFPGPMRPTDVVLSSAGRTEAWFAADAYVRALLVAGGAGSSAGGTASSRPSPRWTPPEQAGGAPWDNAANRYVLGLVAYRLVAGAHPFSGIGLRDAMRAQASAPPPFDEAIARTLRPGLQSLVLAMLDPEAGRRPQSAEEIVRRCDALIAGVDGDTRERGRERDGERAREREGGRARGREGGRADEHGAPSARARQAVETKSGWSRSLLTGAPIAAGLVVGALAFASSRGEAPAPVASPVTIAAQRPLERTTADTCAKCHARQVTEWQRSVMAHAAKSPLFGALESAVEEQAGRDVRCPNGAGVLRRASGDVCRDDKTGLTVTGSGGEHWCVNCHAAGDNLATSVPPWSASAQSFSGAASARRPVKDLLSSAAMEGISCAVCHQTIGPVHAGGAVRAGEYEGNASWTSFVTGAVFRTRPEDGAGVSGIGNSGYLLDASSFLTRTLGAGGPGDPIVHRRATAETKTYLGTSEFCGACHDVRLFGTDSLGVREKGEHFKRLRNAYSEWKTWADTEKAAGLRAASCQDCHMSLYPGVCVAGPRAGGAKDDCPTGFHFEARARGEKARGMVASSSTEPRPITSHYFTSVDLPLSPEFEDTWASDATLDASGSPVGLELRRRQLLTHTFTFALGRSARAGGQLEIPVEIENTGAGHRVPAGFSQEREIWVELSVTDARGAIVYEVGQISDDDADLRDKVFVRVSTRDDDFDFKGKPQGVFGADVVDGPDVPRWDPNPVFGGTTFRGKGLINFQNGFLRCVKCIGVIDRDGKCEPGPGQGRTRADRFEDGAYDLDTGECRSNLSGSNAFFETYFPVGALDADRGVTKAPDAILDTRSVPPGVPLRYTYEIPTGGHPGPYVVRAKLRFRPFPPFLMRAFVDYEARKASQGLRPSGPQLTASMLRRNHPIDLAEASATIE